VYGLKTKRNLLSYGYRDTMGFLVSKRYRDLALAVEVMGDVLCKEKVKYKEPE
jgi:hypothetical protein